MILCVEDEAPVLDSLIRDLRSFEDHFLVEAAASADEARSFLESPAAQRATLALVLCDHLMPGTSGTDFLIELNSNPETAEARKVLVTAQAGLEDTVRAVNRAGLDHYIAKPWTGEDLRGVVREQLTEFVLRKKLNPLPYLAILDAGRLAEAMIRNPPTDS